MYAAVGRGDDAEAPLAARFDVEQMAEHIGVDSLAFISTDGLYRAMGEASRDKLSPRFCDACFTGDYPLAGTEEASGKYALESELPLVRA